MTESERVSREWEAHGRSAKEEIESFAACEDDVFVEEGGGEFEASEVHSSDGSERRSVAEGEDVSEDLVGEG